MTQYRVNQCIKLKKIPLGENLLWETHMVTDLKLTHLEVAIAPTKPQTARNRGNQPLIALDFSELVEMQFKPRNPILEPWINNQDLVMVFGPRGIGKTHFLMSAAYAISTGTSFAKWRAPQPRRVVYLDGELPGVVMQERIEMHRNQNEPDFGFLRIFTPDLLPDETNLPDISTPEGQERVNQIIGDAEVVFIDNLSAWARNGQENDGDSWTPVNNWLLALRRKGLAVVIVHHSGKSGLQRGTSKKEDQLDAVISLTRPKDYDPSKGAVFIAEFTKARHILGDEAQSIELSMVDQGNKVEWSWQTVEASTYDRILSLKKEGLTPNEICEELEINKSTVSRHLSKARENGAYLGAA